MGRLIDADRLKEVFSRNVAGGDAYFDLIDNAPAVEAIPKNQYETKLNADMVAMLENLDLQIDESAAYNLEVAKVQRLIRDKINALRGEQNDGKNNI